MPQSGWWRFTFNPRVHVDSSGHAAYNLLVDDVIAARSYMDADVQTTSDFMMSMNTIQEVNAGQIVTIEWDGDGVISGAAKYAHFTGEYLGNTGPSPPVCEYPGQTFQYPGSCRQYWICQSDVRRPQSSPGLSPPSPEQGLNPQSLKYSVLQSFSVSVFFSPCGYSCPNANDL